MKDKPLLSVIMAEYNTDISIFKQSIESILNQTYSNFELIIIDDCSEMNVKKVVDKYKDERIKIYKNDTNLGLACSLNKAVNLASGEYIIRMDTDDICKKNRFEKQIEYALNHKEYSIIGTRYVKFDDNNITNTSKFFGEVSKKDFLFSTPFCHPSLLIVKKDLIKIGLYPNYKRSQDYAMEMNMYCYGFKGYIMEDVLLMYREDLNSYKKRTYDKRINEMKIRNIYFKKLGFPIYRYIFVIKPLIVGLIPTFIIKRINKIKRK